MGIISKRCKSVRYVYQALAMYFLLGFCSGKGIPAIFIFGDSLIDAGNNLYLFTLAKPLFPNGIDFHYGCPSGRYTNGRTITDLIEQELGFVNFTPPYLAPTTVGDVILKGVNYASSGAGIFNQSGSIFGDRITMDMQISYFEKTKQDIISRIGRRAAKSLLRRSLYIVVTGNNDIGFLDLYAPKMNLSSNGYIDNMISRFGIQLTRLYKLDARKILVVNAGAVGCMPVERDAYPPGDRCIASFNQHAMSYNNKLKMLLPELTKTNAGSIYVYADAYAIFEQIFQNYTSYGFEIADSACCHLSGAHGGKLPCIFGSLVCPDRSKYVFWDAFHPTEAVNLIAVKYIMDGGLNYMSPMNVRQLVNFQAFH